MKVVSVMKFLLFCSYSYNFFYAFITIEMWACFDKWSGLDFIQFLGLYFENCYCFSSRFSWLLERVVSVAR